MTPAASSAAPGHKRLLSLDFFRGITIAAMILVNNPGGWGHVYPPLLHAQWHGWTLTDLIFPFFLFIVGVSITLAFSARKENHLPAKDLYGKIIRRTLVLFALGLFLNGFPLFDFTTIRIPGVLQRIAVCYLVATVLFVHSGAKTQAFWAVALMLIYWAAMQWFPVPGGHLLRHDIPPVKKVLWLFAGGGIAIAIGYGWSHWLPINKNLWTSSYALFMSGMAMVVLSASYYLIDIKGWRRGIKPFCVYGMNAITVFVLSGIVGRLLYLIKWPTVEGVITLKEWLVNNFFLPWLSPLNASLAYALCFVFVSYFAMYYLYKKQIFIKV